MAGWSDRCAGILLAQASLYSAMILAAIHIYLSSWRCYNCTPNRIWHTVDRVIWDIPGNQVLDIHQGVTTVYSKYREELRLPRPRRNDAGPQTRYRTVRE